MWSDVIDLNEFYRSRLGQVTRRLITTRIRELWPDMRGMSVLGLGYATPYLRAFRDEADCVMAVMPAPQGVVHWPENDPCLACLSEETELPFADLSIDRMLLVHAVENCEHLRPMMREAWRVLSDSGRLVVVVPNRRGIWARFEQRSPFGHGHPYSQGQIKRLLRDCLFAPTAQQHALFVPPSRRRIVLQSAHAFERAGNRWFQAVSGVLIIEAAKQFYAATPERAKAPARRRLVAISGRGTSMRNERQPGEKDESLPGVPDLRDST
jgi:SAM-dependent methyltransferase